MNNETIMKAQIKSFILAALLMVGLPLKAQDMNKKEQIISVVESIFEGTDERNWTKVEAAFASSVKLDYTSMAGGEPADLTPQQITGAWSGILPGFDNTRHMVHHFELIENANGISVKHDGTANHYLNGSVWTVVGNYEHQLVQEAGQWKVTAMKFNMEFIDGDTDLPRLASEKVAGKTVSNAEVVDRFFRALETQNFEWLKEVFAENGRQLNPYIPEGFPTIFEGSEGIYKQYSGLTENFGAMKFPREIFTTQNPDVLFVQFRGEIEIKVGGKYENDYLGIFKMKDGKIIEYTELFNPIVMARAFNIDLK